MDVLELDARLEKDMKDFEKNLLKYDKLLKESNDLKNSFVKQSQDLANSYEEKATKLVNEYKSNKVKLETIISEIESYQRNTKEIFLITIKKKEELENSLQEIHNRYESKWEKLNEENINFLNSSDERITNKIKILEDENKKELLKIVNLLTVNEKEVVNSNTKVTKLISDEVYKMSLDITNANDTVKSLEDKLSDFKKMTNSNITNTNEEFAGEFEKIQLNLNKVDENNITLNKSLDLKFQEDYKKLGEKYNKLSKKFNYFSGIIGFILIALAIIIMRRR